MHKMIVFVCGPVLQSEFIVGTGIIEMRVKPTRETIPVLQLQMAQATSTHACCLAWCKK